MTTDIKPDMLSGVQTGNGIPHDRYNIRGIAHVRTNRKDDIFMQRRLGQIKTFPGPSLHNLSCACYCLSNKGTKKLYFENSENVFILTFPTGLKFQFEKHFFEV